MEYIDSVDMLSDYVARTKGSDLLAVDTEFIREKTYYPKLCLIQLATEENVAIVDPLKIDDLTPLTVLFSDTGTVKLFHAAKQDIEIIHHVLGVIPHPVFDTQVAAALLGQSFQMGLASLVQTFCGVGLKKGDSFTDWSRRPLAQSQLEYAADDVVYLPALYKVMTSMLEEKGRLGWMDGDLAELCDPDNYEVDPYERFKRLKRANQLSRRQLAAARELAAWREIRAQKQDVPRKWILTDEQIVEACRRETESIDDLFLIRGIRGHIATRDARRIVELISKGLSLPESDLPRLDQPSANERNVDSEIDLMLALIRLRAKENGIAMQTLASHADLAAVARGHFDDAEVMRGWRRKIVGDELLDLLDGKINLSISDGKLIVSDIR